MLSKCSAKLIPLMLTPLILMVAASQASGCPVFDGSFSCVDLLSQQKTQIALATRSNQGNFEYQLGGLVFKAGAAQNLERYHGMGFTIETYTSCEDPVLFAKTIVSNEKTQQRIGVTSFRFESVNSDEVKIDFTGSGVDGSGAPYSSQVKLECQRDSQPMTRPDSK